MVFLREYGVATDILGIPLIVRDGVDYMVEPEIEEGDVQLSLDGGDYVWPSSLPYVAQVGGTMLQIELTAQELLAKTIAIRFIDQSEVKEWEDQEIIIETYATPESQHPKLGIGYNSEILLDIQTRLDLLISSIKDEGGATTLQTGNMFLVRQSDNAVKIDWNISLTDLGIQQFMVDWGDGTHETLSEDYDFGREQDMPRHEYPEESRYVKAYWVRVYLTTMGDKAYTWTGVFFRMPDSSMPVAPDVYSE